MASTKSARYPWPAEVNPANFVTVKPSLDPYDVERSTNDYKIWKEQMVCLLESQDLMGFIDGQTTRPEDAEELKLWRRTDRLIKGWILGSVTGTYVLNVVVALDTSMEVWLELEKIFKADDDNMIKSEDQKNSDNKDSKWYLELTRASSSGDWSHFEKLLDKKDTFTAPIDDKSDTVLHVAVEREKSNTFLKKLIRALPKEKMIAQNSWGHTALHVAAKSENIEALKMMVDENRDLLYITNEEKRLPVHEAAIYSNEKALRYLISVSDKDVHNSPFVGKLGASLLNFSINSEFIDVALNLVKSYPDLACSKDVDGVHALELLAQKKSLFRSGASFTPWQRWISSVPLISFEMKATTSDIENPSTKKRTKKNSDLFQIIASVVPEAKDIMEKELRHQQTLELLKHLCKGLDSLPGSKVPPFCANAVINAARCGVHEVVEAIVQKFPDAIYAQEPKTKCSIFHVAARERMENVFKLLPNMDERKKYFYNLKDAAGNNFMHTCGELAPPHKLNLVSGAALQMQRELQWFKEMKKYANKSQTTSRNKANKTPQELFTEKHRDLKTEGEKWMKDTATSCSIAAALIATVVYAAAFTVPGGVNGESGVPVFLQRTSFVIFVMSNSVSMFTSATSLLMFLSILISRYREKDFLTVLPWRLCIGLLILFTSITFMMISFSAAIYITLEKKSNLFLIPVALLACLPVASFVFLQFPLLISVMHSTYGPGIFGKKSNRKNLEVTTRT